jgi:hypothetical protein
MSKVLCDCGAIYEMIETKDDPSMGTISFKCVLCEKELIELKGANVGQLRLVVRPETDTD